MNAPISLVRSLFFYFINAIYPRNLELFFQRPVKDDGVDRKWPGLHVFTVFVVPMKNAAAVKERRIYLRRRARGRGRPVPLMAPQRNFAGG